MNKNAPPESESSVRSEAARSSLRTYWRRNLIVMAVLLAIWAAAGLGCGVLFADVLNAWNLPGTGYPLGFWFAQQGSIIVFVFLILIYCIVMNRLDAIHHRELVEIARKDAETSKGAGI